MDRHERREAVHLQLDGDGDQPFDLFGRVTGPFRDQVDQRRREVRIRVHRQPAE
jgi:hypothetical protein